MKHIEIKLDKNTYKLTPSGAKYDLFQIGEDKNGKQTEKNIAFHVSLFTALDRIAKENIGDKEVMTLKEYIDALSDRYVELKDMVELQF